MTQISLIQGVRGNPSVPRFQLQLFKWIGNKQRFAHEIVSYFPPSFNTYIEPFLGSGAVLGTLAPSHAIAGDLLEPLMGIWFRLSDSPDALLRSYATRWHLFQKDRRAAYERIRARFNKRPNPDDLLFLSRSCYGGVVRFRKDGFMSTPVGVHSPISPAAMEIRVQSWKRRTSGTRFLLADFEETISLAKRGDVVYCDPPYYHTQSILYGAQAFDLNRLFHSIENASRKGVFIVLSLDGHKKSGAVFCDIEFPHGLFKREALVNCGRSMLRRFQMSGKSLESEVVADRLLLTY